MEALEFFLEERKKFENTLTTEHYPHPRYIENTDWRMRMVITSWLSLDVTKISAGLEDAIPITQILFRAFFPSAAINWSGGVTKVFDDEQEFLFLVFMDDDNEDVVEKFGKKAKEKAKNFFNFVMSGQSEGDFCCFVGAKIAEINFAFSIEKICKDRFPDLFSNFAKVEVTE